LSEWLVVLVRGVISFFSLLIFTRILGKQQVSQITFFDYIVGITIGSIAATLTTDLSSAAWPHWVGVLVWAVLAGIMQIITSKKESFSEYVNDVPTVVVMDGNILKDNVNRNRYSLNDLLENLRLKGIFDMDEVKFAVLERNGQLSVIRKSEFEKLSVNNVKVDDSSYFKDEIIFSGIVIDHNLSRLNLDHQWLESELEKRGIESTAEVYYAVLDNNRKLHITTYAEKIINSKNTYEQRSHNK
jgi:uncharacterized membrane protein YcaP (DUF421 family)